MDLDSPPTVLKPRSLKSFSLGQNQNVSIAMFPLEALGENPFLLCLSFLWLPTSLGLWPYHSNFQSLHPQIFHCALSSQCLLWIKLLPFFNKDSCDAFMPYLDIQDTVPISRSSTLTHLRRLSKGTFTVSKD